MGGWVAQKALFPFKLFLKLAMGKGFAKMLELLNLINLHANIGEEQKKDLPALQAHNFEEFRAILRGRFPH